METLEFMKELWVLQKKHSDKIIQEKFQKRESRRLKALEEAREAMLQAAVRAKLKPTERLMEKFYGLGQGSQPSTGRSGKKKSSPLKAELASSLREKGSQLTNS